MPFIPTYFGFSPDISLGTAIGKPVVDLEVSLLDDPLSLFIFLS